MHAGIFNAPRAAILTAVFFVAAMPAAGAEQAAPLRTEIAILEPIIRETDPAPLPPSPRRVLEKLGIGIDAIKHVHRELRGEYTDPVRVYPLIGPAKLHHRMYVFVIETDGQTRQVTVCQNYFYMPGN